MYRYPKIHKNSLSPDLKKIWPELPLGPSPEIF